MPSNVREVPSLHRHTFSWVSRSAVLHNGFSSPPKMFRVNSWITQMTGHRLPDSWYCFVNCFTEAVDVAQNRPLWRLIDWCLSLALRTPSGAWQKRRGKKKKKNKKVRLCKLDTSQFASTTPTACYTTGDRAFPAVNSRLLACLSIASESSTPKTDVYVWRYALLVAHARKEEECSNVQWKVPSKMFLESTAGSHKSSVRRWIPNFVGLCV